MNFFKSDTVLKYNAKNSFPYFVRTVCLVDIPSTVYISTTYWSIFFRPCVKKSTIYGNYMLLVSMSSLLEHNVAELTERRFLTKRGYQIRKYEDR